MVPVARGPAEISVQEVEEQEEAAVEEGVATSRDGSRVCDPAEILEEPRGPVQGDPFRACLK